MMRVTPLSIIIIFLRLKTHCHVSLSTYHTITCYVQVRFGLKAELLMILQVLDFVSRYLPAYKAYLPIMYSEGPKGSDPENLLVVEIDEERNPVASC